MWVTQPQQRYPQQGKSPGITARLVTGRALIFTLVWVILTEASPQGWILAVLVIAAATLASVALLPPTTWRWRMRGIVRLLPFFISHSITGGVDVARRALHPRLPLHPGFIDYRLRLHTEAARVFFANTASLLPGTVSAELRANTLRIHALDLELPIHQTLRALEERVAGLFAAEVEHLVDQPSEAP
jgi:multicomponent Na+:H+ antiporter subunit E